MHQHNMTAGGFFASVWKQVVPWKTKQQESFCLSIQNTTGRAHTAAFPACHALAEQFGAIKACKLIA